MRQMNETSTNQAFVFVFVLVYWINTSVFSPLDMQQLEPLEMPFLEIIRDAVFRDH